MTISQNYTGKLIDFCVLSTSSDAGLANVKVGVLDAGSVIAGPYKIIQKFFKFLFTDLGSVVADPNYGTNFSRLLFSGQIHNSAELQLRYYAEMKIIKNYLIESNPTATADELLSNAVLESFDVTGDTATLRIRFTFQDNSKLLAPITISTV